MLLKYTALLALVPYFVSAQTPACALTCLVNNLSSSGCSALTDTACLCSSTPFVNAATSCIQSSCSASDQSAATSFLSQTCLNQGITLSSAAAGSSTAASSAATSSSSAASSSSATSSSSAASSSVSSASSAASSSASSITSAASSSAGAVTSSAAAAASSAAPTGAAATTFKLSGAAAAIAGVAGVVALAL